MIFTLYSTISRLSRFSICFSNPGIYTVAEWCYNNDMNKFTFSNNNKRYHTLAYYNKQTFGARVEKASLDAGFTCPNRDGTVSYGGCGFCSRGSSYFCGMGDLKTQLDREIERIHKKRKDAKIIAYFQSGSNTHAPLETLREIYEPIISDSRLCGLSIATRADCIDCDIADYLSSIAKRTNLTVELGLQTASDATAKFINRSHTFEQFKNGFRLLKSRKIRVCVHIINGLPDETQEDMLTTARKLGALQPDAVKIHMLHIVKGTPFANLDFAMLTRDEYVDTVIKQLEILPPTTVIERLTGDGDKRTLLHPEWTKNKIAVLAQIDREMASRDTYQGRCYCQNFHNEYRKI